MLCTLNLKNLIISIISFLIFVVTNSSATAAANINSDIDEIANIKADINSKDVQDILNSVSKVQSSENYQQQQNWAKVSNQKYLAPKSQMISAQTQIDNVVSAQNNQQNSLDKIKYNLNQDQLKKLLGNYQANPDDSKAEHFSLYKLMIFVSSSIPKSSLKDLMIQAKESGGILVFRGAIGSTKNTAQFLAEISKENVSAIIDPRLFDMFQVKLVPTFVVLTKDYQDCEVNQDRGASNIAAKISNNSNCHFTPINDRITGNITLNYALETIINGNGSAKESASYFLEKLKSKEGSL
jgi:type-F conjugative transfer system pilin assembly protein TrbC